MEKQIELPINLKTDGVSKKVSEKDAKEEAANLLEELLKNGYVNVHKEDISDQHLKNLITTLRD
jgi:hypothetical protein